MREVANGKISFRLFTNWYIIKFCSSIKLTIGDLFRLYVIKKDSWGLLIERDLREVIGN